MGTKLLSEAKFEVVNALVDSTEVRSIGTHLAAFTSLGEVEVALASSEIVTALSVAKACTSSSEVESAKNAFSHLVEHWVVRVDSANSLLVLHSPVVSLLLFLESLDFFDTILILSLEVLQLLDGIVSS